MCGGGLFLAAAALSVGTAFTFNFQTGNYILMVLAALVGMLYSLERRWDFLAGVCWAIVATKPQDGFLLVIPLLLCKRWKVILTATIVCLAATLIASSLIGKPMLDLILEVPQLKSGAGHSIHESARLIPEFLCQELLVRGWSIGAIQFVGLMGGMVLCLVLSWLVCKSDDWLVRIAPAVLCASLWTYMREYDRCIFFVLQMAFATRCIVAENKIERMFMYVMMAVVFCSCLETINNCITLMPKIGEKLQIPNFAQYVFNSVGLVNTVSSTLLVCSFVLWCVMVLRRNGAKI